MTLGAIDLGRTDEDSGLRTAEVRWGDGWTIPTQVAGVDCRRNWVECPARPGGQYMYFLLAQALPERLRGRTLYVRVEYFDHGSGTLELQYDALGDGAESIYRSAGSVTLSGAQSWRAHTFELPQVHFGGRQNGGADFRLWFGAGGASIAVNRLTVTDAAPASAPSVIRPGRDGVVAAVPFRLTWACEQDPDESEIVVSARPGRPASDARATLRVPGPVCTCDVDSSPALRAEDAAAGGTVFVCVRSRWGPRWSTWSEPVPVFVHTGPPGRPIILPGSTTGLVAWEGEPHTAYEVEVRQGTETRSSGRINSPWSHHGPARSAGGPDAEARVRLMNDAGTGEWSDWTRLGEPAEPPASRRLVGYSPAAYSAIADQDFDYRPVFTEMATWGVNFTRQWVLEAWAAQWPFVRDADGRFDLMRLDEQYLAHMRDLVALANSLGICVQVCLFDHCGLRHRDVYQAHPFRAGNNTQGVDINETNWFDLTAGDGMVGRVHENLARTVTRYLAGYDVVLEVINEPLSGTDDQVLDFHRAAYGWLRDAGARVVSANVEGDLALRCDALGFDMIAFHWRNGCGEPPAGIRAKVIGSTDTGTYRDIGDDETVLQYARDCAARGYHFEHLATQTPGDMRRSFIRALGETADRPTRRTGLAPSSRSAEQPLEILTVGFDRGHAITPGQLGLFFCDNPSGVAGLAQ